MLKDLNLSYILNEHGGDLTRETIQCIFTAIIVWLGKTNPRSDDTGKNRTTTAKI